MADILLIHGSCHGAWCWRDTIPALEVLGHRARAIDLPSHGEDRTPVADVTLDSYATAIVNALGAETVLLGHSLGGYPITAAAERAPDRIERLIYLSAHVPEAGCTMAQMRARQPRQPLVEALRMDEDGLSFTVDPAKAPALFYHDCPTEAVAFALENLCAQALAPGETVINLTEASQSLPRRYIRCLDDRTVLPEYQRALTQDWPQAHVHDLDTSHSPFFSDPAGLARQIDAAIRR